MLKKANKFELSILYFQEQNGILERKVWILIDQVKNTLIEGNISNNFWLEVLLAIIYVSNLLSISFLNGLSCYEKLIRLSFKLNHLRVLESIVYVFVYKEK